MLLSYFFDTVSICANLANIFIHICLIHAYYNLYIEVDLRIHVGY